MSLQYVEHHSQQCVERLPTAHSHGVTAIEKAHPVPQKSKCQLSHRWMLSIVLFPVQVVIFDLNQHDANMRVDVYPTGEVNYITGSTAHGWVSLSGIIFEAV